MASRLGVLAAGCLWGALTGWAAAMLAARPAVVTGGAAPEPVLLVYGALACFGAGYVVGSALRGRPPGGGAARAAGLAGVVALAAKAAAPGLAAWTATLIAAAVFGALAGVARTRRR